ncbi:MAG: CRISPR-associated helicase Cas3' [Selenomonadaceae bacterium]|nr:CRISPR-associated helicase Cas3' [Selenomonadaceae bacterium]
MTDEKNKVIHISKKTKNLWGKLSKDTPDYWLPLWVHLFDTCEVAKLIWHNWVPKHTKHEIANGMEFASGKSIEEKLQYAGRVYAFLAAVHDIGKASPVFVIKAAKAGFPDIVDEIADSGLNVSVKKNGINNSFTHAIIGERILERAGLDCSYGVIIGGHHGKPADEAVLVERTDNYPDATGVGEEVWDSVHKELIGFGLQRAELESLPIGKVSLTAQVLLTGLLIMADWFASGTDYFPLLNRMRREISEEELNKRAEKAWDCLSLPCTEIFSSDCSMEELFQKRFGRPPRPLQECAVQKAAEVCNPGLFIIEAPMGEGKTEAALVAAEIIARRTGMGGIYFALPTQATSDGIFPRIIEWIEALRSGVSRTVFLAHGKSGFNKDYEGIKINSLLCDEENDDLSRPSAIVNDWTAGRKKGMLADFVVGTVDHVLMAGLKMKHLAMRHLGLANKIVIIDECHAYDAYMSSYLDLVLSWLGAYHVPVILLSATLPAARRKSMLDAYGSAHRSKEKKENLLASLLRGKSVKNEKQNAEQETLKYPLISYTDGNTIFEAEPAASGRNLTVELRIIDTENLADNLRSLLSGGGCVGIIRNTVSEAQQTAQMLEEIFGAEHVYLLHSRFLSADRVRKEQIIRGKLGPGDKGRPSKMIVVGTQVMEQSLDVDFDVLFTDICPMDLLLQRMGRLHRHERESRPVRMQKPVCYIMGIENDIYFAKGNTAVYGDYLLLKTRAFLKDTVNLPEDIPLLVSRVYDKRYDDLARGNLSKYAEQNTVDDIYLSAEKKYQELIAAKTGRAATFQIKKPNLKKGSMFGWLKARQEDDKSGKRAEATVRDASDSVQVVVVVKKNDGRYYTVPWLMEYPDKEITGVPSDRLAKAIAGCSVALPSLFAAPWNMNNTISALEKLILEDRLDQWYSSCWLDGELFLVLDEDLKTILLDKTLVYNEKYGLYIEGE